MSTPGNIEQARLINAVENRAETVAAHAIALRDQTVKASHEHQKLDERISN